jgi:ketosteroid isomerase-like protein
VSYPDAEVVEAFHGIWTTGSTNEDWSGWVEHLTPDVEYVERIFGRMNGREEVRAWITSLMAVRFDVHAVLNWYIVAGDRVVLDMDNRYYHPDPSQPPIDFGGVSILTYGGEGLLQREEDYWDAAGSKEAWLAWDRACTAWGGKGLEGGRLEQLESDRIAANLETLRSGRIT